MPSQDWYYTRAGQQQGPISLDALQNMARDGELQANELVWTEGMTNWALARTVAHLFPASTPIATAALSIDRAPASANSAAAPVGVIGYYTPTHQFVFAGFWLRFCAMFIDGLILTAPIAGMGIASQIAIRQNSNISGPGSMAILGLGLDGILLLGNWLYFALMESSSWQATLGKRLLGIQVIDESGARISFGRATGRYFGKIVSYMIFYIGFIMAGFTQKKQALHDLMAGTLVIRKNP